MDEVEVLRANESPEGDSSEGTTIKKRIAVIEGALGLIGILGIVAYVYMKPSTGRIVGGVMRIPHPHGRVRHGPGRMQGMGSVDASRRRPSLKERRCRRSFPDAINGRGASGTGVTRIGRRYPVRRRNCIRGALRHRPVGRIRGCPSTSVRGR